MVMQKIQSSSISHNSIESSNKKALTKEEIDSRIGIRENFIIIEEFGMMIQIWQRQHSNNNRGNNLIDHLEVGIGEIVFKIEVDSREDILPDKVIDKMNKIMKEKYNNSIDLLSNSNKENMNKKRMKVLKY